MTRAEVELSAPLEDEDVLQISETFRRSFDFKSLVRRENCVEVVVGDDMAPVELETVLKRVVRARRYAFSESLFVREATSGQNGDPQPLLQDRGDVRSLAPGLFAFSGDFLRVRTALDARVRAIAALHKAAEISYPALWPIEVLQAIDYFHDFPHLTMLASGVEPSFAARNRFAERFSKRIGRGSIECNEENGLAPARHALAPTVCDCCYWLLKGRRDVADQMFTIHGQVFRNERSQHGALDRLTAYTMREIVMVGSPAFVLSRRDALVDEVIDFMSSLDLSCDIRAADDPFFCNDSLQKTILQNLNRLKYEVNVQLYDGRTTAVASINLHNDFFSQNYDYTQGETHLFSACVAFGYERLTYALFCRHGADLSSWPRQVLDLLELEHDARTDGQS